MEMRFVAAFSKDDEIYSLNALAFKNLLAEQFTITKN